MVQFTELRKNSVYATTYIACNTCFMGTTKTSSKFAMKKYLNVSSFLLKEFLRCDSHRGAGGVELPDHRGDEGGDEAAQQLVHHAEEVQQLCVLEEEEEEVVDASS